MAMINIQFGSETVGSHVLKHVPFVIGRDPKCDVVIDNPGLSRQHCRISHMGGMFHIEDLKSSNGTYLNGERVDGAPLKDGDQIRIGKYTIVFHQAAGEGSPPAKGSQAPAPSGAAPQAAPKTGGIPDIGQTFQLDAESLKKQASAEMRRAAEIAGIPKKGSMMPLVVGVLALLVLALAAALAWVILKHPTIPPVPTP
jgi:predicted component of type VI protein secretion system